MRTAALALTASVAVLAVSVPRAWAAPQQVDPARAVAWPVVDVVAPVQDLVYAEANADASVTEQGDIITLGADVFFAYNSDALTDRAREELARVTEKLRAAGGTTLTVTGHTDATGATSHNQGLSERRAAAVQAALQGSLPGVNVQASGKGASEPVAGNDTDEGRALNRRVVIAAG